MKKESDLLSYGCDGWPEYRMNLREIIESLGVFVKNEETGKYEISNDNEFLDAYPHVLAPNCSGNLFVEKVEIYTNSAGEKSIKMFTKKKDKNLD